MDAEGDKEGDAVDKTAEKEAAAQRHEAQQ